MKITHLTGLLCGFVAVLNKLPVQEVALDGVYSAVRTYFVFHFAISLLSPVVRVLHFQGERQMPSLFEHFIARNRSIALSALLGFLR
jgi:hypothetical protein